jgi:ferredoxin-NADP reductase
LVYLDCMRRSTLWFYWYITWEAILGFRHVFRLHSLTLKESRREGEDIRTFVFAPKKKVKFEAGQYGLWFMPKFIWGKPARLFTVAASPTEDTVQVSTRISGTDFKQQLAKLSIGDRVYMLGPIGRFVLGKKPPKAAVLVAGGIGVTPMRAISKFVHDSDGPTKLTLIHSASGFYLYRKEFEQYVPSCHFVTKETLPQTLEQVARQASPDTPFYVSGPPAFVVAVEASLKKLGRKNIRQDGFLGY